MRRTIGEMIRELRKEKMITQEKLAEVLNVSFQSVSRWENGLANPDISLIPIIARFFNVSTDYLFDMHSEEYERKRENYEAAWLKARSSGDISGCIALMEDAVKEFPQDYHFMMNLAESMECYAGGNAAQKASYAKQKYAERIYTLSQRVLKNCSADTERFRAAYLLCNYYVMAGNSRAAIQLLEGVADIRHSREMMLEQILQGEDKLKKMQENMLSAIEYAAESMIKIAFRREYGFTDKLTVDEKIVYVTTAIQLYEMIFPDGNYLYYHRPVCWNFRRLAELYLLKGETEKAYRALLRAETHAEAFDMLNESAYTSIFLNKLICVPETHTKEWVGSERGMLSYRLSEMQEYFEGHEGFVALKTRLEVSVRNESRIELE